MQRKFKVGDKVVVLSVSKSLATPKLVGTVSTIKETASNHIGPYINLEAGWGVYEFEAELESIYNSPLYKALL